MIAQIENAILARLRLAADTGALGYRWRLVETYPADWDEYFKTKAQLDAPAVWVTFGGFEKFDWSNDGPIGTAAFGVVVASRNLRNETATRHGGDVPGGALPEPGSYQLMADAIALLDGQDFGLDIEGLELVDVRLVESANLKLLRQHSLIAIRWRTTFTLCRMEVDAEPAADLKIFHANWDVPAFHNVDADPAMPGAQIPADATADATDHLELDR